MRVFSFLQIRPGEGVKVAFVAALFAFVQAGQGIGGNAADSLFFIRFGVQFLPYLFMGLGALTFVMMLLYSAGLIRIPQRRYFAVLLVAFAAILVAERLALWLDFAPLYPLLWLSVNLFNTVLGTLIWYIAGEVCDTRQAKRLFSLFASAGILGGVIGNFVTGYLARAIGTENLLVLYAALIGASLWLTLEILGRFFHSPVKRNLGESLWHDLRIGYDYVRVSPLLMLTAYASVLFSILYFSISFPFSQAVSSAFPNEANLAGFLGIFSSVATLVTFFVSLVVANRIFTWIGIVNAVLMLPLVYLGGFILWSANFMLATAVIARLAQLVVLGGIASTAWTAVFNVVPPERRGQVLGFDAGVPSQVGVFFSGVLLILGGRVLDNTQILIMGMLVAMACAYLVWRMRRAYGDALVHALRAGRLEVFSPSPRAFASFHGNASAIRIVVQALQDLKPSTRRIAADLLGKMENPAAVAPLAQASEDQDAQVRLAAVRALGHLDGGSADKAVMARLDDSDPAVRAASLEILPQLKPARTPDLAARLRRMLQDADARVSTRAAVAMAQLFDSQPALARLDLLVCDEDANRRVYALDAFGQVAALGIPMNGRVAVARAALDPIPSVRRAACQALGAVKDQAGIDALVVCLDDADETVRGAAVAALRACGPAALNPLLHVLEVGTVRAQEAALEALPANDRELFNPLFAYAQHQITRIRGRREIAGAIPAAGRVTRLLHDWLESRTASSEARLVKVVGLLGNAEAMGLVARSLRSRTGENRAEAIEALETLGDRRLSREIILLLDDAPAGTGPSTAQALVELLAEADGWTRALAARAIAELQLRDLIPQLTDIAEHDPEPLPRQAALGSLQELGVKLPMETLQTVSSLERILLLREVPLFAELSPDDLKQIADVAREQWYPDSAVLCREGDEGNEMYVIVSGQVGVSRQVNGADKRLAQRGAGESIGEMAIIDSAPRSATVRAAGEVRVLVLQADAFKAILRDRPEVSLAVMRVMSRRLREN
ncbi:MAG: HEAT repeat domain-containing protein [Anaerolineae bacterium]